MQEMQCPETADALKTAAMTGNLGEWDSLLTAAVVRACAALGWASASKGHPLKVPPQAQQEYLGIDVMAFPPGAGEC